MNIHRTPGQERSIDLFVARQPVFDVQDQLMGYELLYRKNADENWATGENDEQMSADVLITAVLSLGLDRLVRDTPAFVNCSKGVLRDGSLHLLPRERIIIELLETVPLDDSVLAACAELSAAGYRIALDDFEFPDGWEAFIPYTEIIKVDVLGRTPEQIHDIARRLRPTRCTLLAERVESADVHRSCADAGFQLFQGFFYTRPEITRSRDLSLESIQILQLINLLQEEGTTEAEIVEAFRADISLTYKLLRIASTVPRGYGHIDSIRHAIRIIGRSELLRWMELILVSSVGRGTGVGRELVQTAVQRGRMCEMIARSQGWRSEEEGSAFMVGLFSVLDSILRVPMEEILSHLQVTPEIRDALLHRGGPYAAVLALTEAYGSGHWDDVSGLSPITGVSALQVTRIYLESVSWAQKRTGICRI